jgi:hypothetical protein
LYARIKFVLYAGDEALAIVSEPNERLALKAGRRRYGNTAKVRAVNLAEVAAPERQKLLKTLEVIT